ncbi:MAG: hypothetical protein QME47_08065 [Candidatus Thermoplasmatota archaeon]|nr:hypothetical protein [Candidatus Thermoplasmatota archaeon]
MEEESKEKVLVEGVILSVTLPSEALLEKTIRELYKKVVGIRKDVETAPTKYLNRFKSLRKKWYCSILQKYAVKIGPWYLLPTQNIPEFQAEKNKFIQEYAELEKQLIEFAKEGNHYTELLKELNVSPRTPRLTERVHIRMIPLSLSQEFFSNFLEQRAREQLKEIDAEKQHLLEQAQEEMEKVRREMVQQAIDDLNMRLEQLICKLAEAAKRKITKRALKSLENTVNNISDLASVTGTSYYISERLKTASELISSAKTGRFSEKALELTESEELSPRLKAFMEQLTKEK